MQNKFSGIRDEFKKKLTDLVSESGGNISNMKKNMNIPLDMPASDLEELNSKLKVIAGGESSVIEAFADDAIENLNEGKEELLSTTPGGVTRWEPHVTGWKLFLSHDFIQQHKTIPELIAATKKINPILAPVLASVAPVLFVEMNIFSRVDRGNGVYWKNVFWAGPPIGPLPQPQ